MALAVVLLLAEGRGAGAAQDRCAVPLEVSRLGGELPDFSARLRSGSPLTIVALGSSSTYGTGASGPEHSYPRRLEAELRRRFPGTAIRVINRGVGGETERDMAARLDRDVLAEHPDLVIWQAGTNAVLRDEDPVAAGDVVRQGVVRLKAAGSDVVLMDLQYAPAVLAHPHYRDMLRVLAFVAHRENIGMFRRYAVMRYWAEEPRRPIPVALAADHLHMNDQSYDCLARLLAKSLAGAVAERPQIATAW